MWYAPKAVGAAPTPIVSVDDVRRRASVDFGDDDDLVGDLIAEATDHVEKICGLRLAKQSFDVECESFDDLVRLPIGPVRGVSAIAYVDVAGDPQTVDAAAYEWLAIDNVESLVRSKPEAAWPAVKPGTRIAVTMDAGFDPVPPAVRGAIVVYCVDKYETRENGEVNGRTNFDDLLCNFRRG